VSVLYDKATSKFKAIELKEKHEVFKKLEFEYQENADIK
jgi:hypothetical protein